MEKYEKSWNGLPSSLKSKRSDKPPGSYFSPLPIFWGYNGCFDVECAQLHVVEITTAYTYACVTISGAVYRVWPMRATTVHFASLFLGEKALVSFFRLVSIDLISRNNGSWALSFFFFEQVGKSVLQLTIYFFTERDSGMAWGSYLATEKITFSQLLVNSFLFLFFGNKVDWQGQLLRISSGSDYHTIL